MSDEPEKGPYISEDEVQEHLDSPMNVLNRIQFKKKYNGGKEKGPNHPETTKVLAGVFANISGNKAAGEAFGMSGQQAMNIKKGNSGSKELQEKIDESLGRVRDVALEKLTESLGFITGEKLEKASVRDLASVAKDMATVVEKSAPASQKTPHVGVQFQIMTVEPYKDESRYQVVEINPES